MSIREQLLEEQLIDLIHQLEHLRGTFMSEESWIGTSIYEETILVILEANEVLKEVETTYVERRVPSELEDEAHTLIDDWLKYKGFDPREI